MATRNQIAMIHVLISRLGIADEDYRDMLAVYNVDSSKDACFTVSQAADLINCLVEKARGTGAYIPKKEPAIRMASKAQKAMLLNMWFQVSRQPTDAEKVAALRVFVKNRFHIDSLEWLPASAVQRIKKTLEAMGANYVAASR
jgi:hypothetical protein